MIVQVISTNLNATKVTNAGKTLTGLSITYQGEPYKGKVKDPVERFVFTDSPIAEGIESAEPGDWFDISFDTTQWKNPVSMVKTSAPKTQEAATPNEGTKGVDWDLKDKKISRAVAFKGAVEMVTALLATGDAFPKASHKKPDFFVEQIQSMAKKFEPFLNIEEDVTVPENPEAAEVPFNQETFQE